MYEPNRSSAPSLSSHWANAHALSEKPRLFVAGGTGLGDPEVKIFSVPEYRNVGHIANSYVQGPAGLWVDRLRNLYVADIKGYVTEYADGKRSPKCTYNLQARSGYPNAVTTDDEGRVYVAATYRLRYYARAFLDVFAQCGERIRHTPLAPSSHYSYAYGVAVDSKRDIFVGYQVYNKNPYQYRFVEFILGRRKPLRLGAVISLVSSFGVIGGIILDKANDLISAGGTSVYLIRPPYNSAAVLISGLYYPINVSLNRSETLLYSADGPSKTVTVYKYPSAKLVKKFPVSFAGAGPAAVAADPGATF